MKTFAAVLLALALAGCGGGGGSGGSDAPTDPALLFSSSVPDGSVTSDFGMPQGSRPVGSFAYTNTTNAPMSVRVSADGMAASTGRCSCSIRLSIVYDLPSPAPLFADSISVPVTSSMAGVSGNIDVVLPPGSTLGAAVVAVYDNASGPVSIRWSSLGMSLRAQP